MIESAVLRVSAEEYLRQERARIDGRAELLDGEIVMMAGATRRHTILTSSIDAALNNRLAGTPCQAVTSNLRVKPEMAETYTYPDVVVFCDEDGDAEEDVLTNPIAIFEVLSPPTRSRDRGDKFAYYRTIPSLHHYVLVSPDERSVDHYARRESNVWTLAALEGDAVLSLDPPGVELPLDEIYRRARL